MRVRGLVCFLAIGAMHGAALAHHPGSHAVRGKDGRVKIEILAAVGETCLAVGTIRVGMPPAVLPPPGATPVTAEVRRTDARCTAGAASVRGEGVLEIGPDVRQIHLYVVGPEGSLIGTERIPLR